jgi:hypothetical protein
MVLELMPGGPEICLPAVYLALTAARRAELTAAERLIAAAFILAAGRPPAEVAARLGVTITEACRMRARLCAALGLS